MRKQIRTIILAAGLMGCGLTASATELEGESTPVNYDQQVINAWSHGPESEYYSVRLGVTAPQLFLDTRSDPSRHSQAGLSLGFAYGLQLTSDYPLFVEPGIFYVSKGITVNRNLDAANYQKKMSIRMHTFEIPVVFKYKVETIVDDMTIDPFFGGFFSLGLGGKTKYFDDVIDPQRYKESTYRSNGFKSFDAGLRFGCGLSYQQLYVEAAYNIGLANIARSNMTDFGYDNFDDSVRMGCFNLSIGVNF